MANILIVEHKSMDEVKEKEWCNIVTFFTGIQSIRWNPEKAQTEAVWYWGQEEKIRELIKIIESIFGEEVEIRMENGKQNGKQTLIQNHTIPDIPTDEENIHSESKEESKEIKVTPILEASNEEEVVTEKTVEISTSPPEEEKKSIPEEEYEKALKELFGSKIEGYDFTAEKAEKEATRFCSNFEIKSESIRFAMTLVGMASNETVFINALSRLLCKNKALAKAELRKSFEKWMATTYPHFIEAYPGVNVFHFLNIFRDENNKF